MGYYTQKIIDLRLGHLLGTSGTSGLMTNEERRAHLEETCKRVYEKHVGISTPEQPEHIKCGICGSTAIDHTEAHCQLNKILKVKESKQG
jgi:hypothetical protein